MEIRVYKNLQCRSTNKYLFCARVECPDAFSFSSAINVFRSIYGNCIIEFLCV